MAYVKVSTTKNTIAALRYGEHEQSVIRGGVDCPEDTETAIKLFKADRIMWNKDSGIQAISSYSLLMGVSVLPRKPIKSGRN
mgnify:CR=1 FL=1